VRGSQLLGQFNQCCTVRRMALTQSDPLEHVTLQPPSVSPSHFMQPDEVMSPTILFLPLPILSLGIIPLISLTAHLSLSPLSLSSFDSPTCGRHCQMPIPSLSISLYHHPCLYSTTSRIASSSLSSSYACNISSPLSLSTCTSGLCGQSHTLKRKPPHIKNDMPLMT
jgi:hypothetical protein